MNLEDQNISILALTYGRPDHTSKVWGNNLSNHRFPGQIHLAHWDNSKIEDSEAIQTICEQYDRGSSFVTLENEGISRPLNKMMKIAFESGSDFVVTMANDILEPEGWIARLVLAAMEIPKAGVIAIPPKDNTVMRYPSKNIAGWNVEEGDVIGNYLITKELWKAIGGFSEEYGMYGPIDLDYCARARLAGFKTLYLADMKSEHIGLVQEPDYYAPKADSLLKAWPKFYQNLMQYKYGTKNLKV